MTENKLRVARECAKPKELILQDMKRLPTKEMVYDVVAAFSRGTFDLRLLQTTLFVKTPCGPIPFRVREIGQLQGRQRRTLWNVQVTQAAREAVLTITPRSAARPYVRATYQQLRPKRVLMWCLTDLVVIGEEE